MFSGKYKTRYYFRGNTVIKTENVHNCQMIGMKNTSHYWFYNRERSILVKRISPKIYAKTLRISRTWIDRMGENLLQTSTMYSEHHKLKGHVTYHLALPYTHGANSSWHGIVILNETLTGTGSSKLFQGSLIHHWNTVMIKFFQILSHNQFA